MDPIPVQRFSIPPDHPSLAGHFPGNPVVPGVLLLEHVLDAVESRLGWPRVALRLPQVKFLRPLLPAQWAEISLESVAADRCRFRITCEDQLLASGELGRGA